MECGSDKEGKRHRMMKREQIYNDKKLLKHIRLAIPYNNSKKLNIFSRLYPSFFSIIKNT